MARGRAVSKLADDVRIRVERGCPAPTNFRIVREYTEAGYRAIEVQWDGVLTEYGVYSGRYYIYLDGKHADTTDYNERHYNVDGNVIPFPPKTHEIWVTAYCMDLDVMSSKSNSIVYNFEKQTVDITATSPIPLYFSSGGDAPKLIPHTVSTSIRGEASELAIGMTEGDVIAYYHVDTFEEVVIEYVRLGYQAIATWNLGQGTVHFDVTPTTNILLVPIVTDITIISKDEARFTFESLPDASDLTIRCDDPILRLRPDGQWAAMCVAGIKFRDINTLNNTAILPCCGGKVFEYDQDYKTTIRFLAPHYEPSPIVQVTFGGQAQVTVDIPASIAAGGIPEAIRTGRDEEITFIVKNLGTEAVVADVFLTFENHDIPRVYPHDLTGLEPLGYGYGLPGSDILILEDAYVAKEFIAIGAGASSPYMLTVQLPHDAIPPGEGSATYTIKIRVGVYQ